MRSNRTGRTLPPKSRTDALRHIRLRVLLAVTGLALATCVTPSATPNAASETNGAALFPDPVVAKGKGFEIRRSELDESVGSLRATLAAQNQGFSDHERETVAARLLDRMVINRILQLRATDEDRAKAREMAEKFVADTKAKALSEESYRRQLRATGITPELFAKRALEQAVVENVIGRELKSTITVPDEHVRDFYERGIDSQAREVQAVVDKLAKTGPDTVFYTDGKAKFEEITRTNLARLERPEQVRANIIVLYTVDRVTQANLTEADCQAKRELADRLLTRLKAGEDIGSLAREYSDDQQGRLNGGQYTILRDTQALPELADLKLKLFELPINQIAGPFTNKLGLYLVRVLERTPAGKSSYDKAAEEIRNLLIDQQLQKLLPDYTAKLKEEYGVEISFGP